MNEYNPIEIYDDEEQLTESKLSAAAKLANRRNIYGLAAAGLGLKAGYNAMNSDGIVDPDTAKAAALGAGSALLGYAAKKRSLSKALQSIDKKTGTIVGSVQNISKLAKPAAKGAVIGAGLYGGYQGLKIAKDLKDAAVNKINPSPKSYAPSISTPTINTPSKETISKVAKIGAGGAAALATAGIVAAMIANNINKKYEWKIDGCDKLDGEQKEKCLKYIKSQKQKAAISELKQCKYSNDPTKCESLVKSKFKGN